MPSPLHRLDRPRRLLTAGLVVGALCAAASARSSNEPMQAAGAVSAGGWSVRHWTISDGLPQGSIFGLAQTPDGYLWLATYGGLVRFDGARFTAIDGSVLPTLASNVVTALVTAREGGVWAASVGTPIVRTDGHGESQVLPPRPGRGASDALLVARDGSLWLGGNFDLNRFADGAWQALAVPARAGHIRTLAEDADGTVWVGADGGVFRVDGTQIIATPQDASPARVDALARDRTGCMWAGSTTGLFRFERVRGAWRGQRVAGFEVAVTALTAGPDGRLWIGTAAGVYALDRGGTASGTLPRLVVPTQAIDTGTVTRLLVTSSGAVVAGTTDAGFAVITRRVADMLGTEQGLPDSRTHHVVGDGAGGMWIGGGCEGVTHVTAGSSAPSTHRPPELGLSTGCVRGLMRDRSGALWIGQSIGALTRVSPDWRTRTWTTRDGLPPTDIGPLLEDRDGRVWIGSLSGVLCRIDAGDRLSCPVADLGGAALKIWSIAQAADGAVWVGQVGRLSRIDGPGITTLTTGDGVPPAPLRVLQPTRDGALWIGTYGSGLAVLRGNRISTITTAHGLFDNAISGLVDDGAGRVWLLGNRGVAMMRREDLEAVASGTLATLDGSVFGPGDGVPEGNGGHPAAARLDDGRLAFATVRGLAIVSGGTLPGDATPTPVIEAVRGARSAPGSDYTVTPDGGPLEIRFAAPAIGRPGDVRVRYQLAGHDTTWLDAGSEQRAIYSGLAPGTYAFRVAARQAGSSWAQPVEALTVHVLPRWWQTWVARLLATVSAALVVVAGVRWRLQTLEARNRALTTEIRERKRAEAEAHRHLLALAHVGRVSTAGQLTASLAHELGQPLMAIVAHADAARMLLEAPSPNHQHLIESVDDIAEQGQRASEVIRQFRRLLGRGSADPTPLAISEVVREVMTLLDSTLRSAGTRVDLQLTETLPSITGERVPLGQVVINLVLNAIDAMRALPADRRCLVVRTSGTPTHVRVSVLDSGHGIGPDVATTLFEPFQTTKTEGMGMGLAISRSIVEAHHGRIRARNRPGGGAVFSFVLPIAAAAQES